MISEPWFGYSPCAIRKQASPCANVDSDLLLSPYGIQMSYLWETSEQQPIDFLYFWQVHLLSDKAPCNVEELCEINTYIFMCNYDPWMRFSLLVKWFQKGMSPGGHSRGYYPDTLSALSSHCDSSEDQLHVDEICGYPIFTFTKAAVIWLNDRVLR